MEFMKDDKINKKELKHDEVPGYRHIFYTILAGFVIYMIIIFNSTDWAGSVNLGSDRFIFLCFPLPKHPSEKQCQRSRRLEKRQIAPPCDRSV